MSLSVADPLYGMNLSPCKTEPSWFAQAGNWSNDLRVRARTQAANKREHTE
jgi:hypothetical protein